MLFSRHMFYVLFVIVLLVGGIVPAQSFVPGTTYYGRKNYITYHAGNSPLIFSAPHGGNVSPSVIPDRTCNSPVLVADANTADLAMRIDSACMIVFGCHPHIVICNMSRKKVDCNRNEADGTCGNSEADIAWQDFHSYLDTAVQAVIADYGKGFYIDLHGHGHPIQRLEMGYLIHNNQLALADSVLNKAADTIRFGMHHLWSINQPSLSLTQLLRGPDAIGTQLAQRGYPAVPSQQDPYPLPGDPYFDGGYNTDRYGSANGGAIDGFQIEHNLTGVRDTYHNRAVYADTLIQVMKTFLLKYYFNPATLSGCKLVTGEPELAVSNLHTVIYPNPVTNTLTVHFPQMEGYSTLSLINLQGQIISCHTYQQTSDVLLDLENTPSGLYFLRLQSGNQDETQKLLILPR